LKQFFFFVFVLRVVRNALWGQNAKASVTYSPVNYHCTLKGPKLVTNEELSRAHVMLFYALSETRLLLICCVLSQTREQKRAFDLNCRLIHTTCPASHCLLHLPRSITIVRLRIS